MYFMLSILCLHIFLLSTIFFVFPFFSVLCCIVSHCPYYSSSHASVKVREGSSYWGPLGYEALVSPQIAQSPDPQAAARRACIFKFKQRKKSFQSEKRWDWREKSSQKALLLAFRELVVVYQSFISLKSDESMLNQWNILRTSAG